MDMVPACFGFKYRIHPLAAAITSIQLRYLDEWNSIRRSDMVYITRALSEIGEELGGVFDPPYEAPETERLWYGCVCQYYSDKTEVPRADL